MHHLLRVVRSLKTWQLIVLLLILTLLSATLLRLNNLGMVERRSAVLAADEAGDREKVKRSLVELQSYVTAHMNAGLGDGFYLSSSYERDRDAALNAANNQSSNPNSAIYQQASFECRSRFQGGRESFRNDYVQCVIDRVGAMSPQSEPTSGLQLPRADNYKINYASPTWSLDLAGVTVAACVLIVLVIILRAVLAVVLGVLLRRRYRDA